MKATNSKAFLVFFFLMYCCTVLFAQEVVLLDSGTQQKFVNQLPRPAVMQPLNPGGTYYQINAKQFEQDLGLRTPAGKPFMTTVWGYNGIYPGSTIEVRRNRPITVKWNNALVAKDGNPLPHLFPVDTSINWAMPSNWPACGVPLVTHLHGGHVQSESDGNPNAWYTPYFAHTGSYFSQQIYSYPNDQETGTCWYHDDALGISRLNVYAGLTGFYLLRSRWEDNLNLPSGNYEIPMLIQDKMFTTDGQLYFPSTQDIGGQPDPSIQTEMFGDFILVNGKTWPVLNLEPRKYRFRFLNGSDSRFYNLYFNEDIEFIQIGTDGGLLNAPVKLHQLLLGNGERKDVIIDFSDPTLLGKTIIMHNNARCPFPQGALVDSNTSQIMAFKVVLPLSAKDNSEVRSTLREFPISALGDQTVTRKLILAQKPDEFGRLKSQLGTLALGTLNFNDSTTENPALNSIEEWEIINNTSEAQPIHLHLVNFQLVNRQKFDRRQFKPGTPSTFHLIGSIILPSEDQAGWKDTQIMYPGEVTRIKARFNTKGLYLWHCSILSHEDHQMMRPFYVGSATSRITASNPEKFKVTVYPNPLTNTSVVSMNINASGNYKAEIYNSNGQRICILNNSYYAKGIHELSLRDLTNGNFSNGVYLLRIQGGDGIFNSSLLFKCY